MIAFNIDLVLLAESHEPEFEMLADFAEEMRAKPLYATASECDIEEFMRLSDLAFDVARENQQIEEFCRKSLNA